MSLESEQRRDAPAIGLLPPRLALMTLVGHTYGSAFLDRSMRAREFDVLCRLVEEVPVRELRFSDDLGALVVELPGARRTVRRPVRQGPALLA